MKKILFLALIGFFLVGCTTTKRVITKDGESIEVITDNVQFRDDFTKVSEATRLEFLKKHKAESENYAMLILTLGYKGESVKVYTDKNKVFQGTTYTKKANGIAGYMRIDSGSDVFITDDYSNKIAVLESKHLKKYKFAYVMKDNSLKDQPYKITYSNNLRPL